VLTPDGNSFGAVQSITNGTGIGFRLAPISIAGTYTVIVIPAGNATGSAQLTLWSDVTGTLVIETPSIVHIIQRQQAARPTFAGVAGQTLRLALTNSTLPASSLVQVLSPDGSALTSQIGFSPPGTTLDVPALSATGTYTVVVTPAAGGTGDVTLNLSTR